MDIKLDDDYKITSGQLNLILQKRVPAYKGRGGKWMEEKYVDDGYYSTIQHLLKGYMKKKMINNTSKSIQDLIDVNNEVIKTIDELKIKWEG